MYTAVVLTVGYNRVYTTIKQDGPCRFCYGTISEEKLLSVSSDTGSEGTDLLYIVTFMSKRA